MIIRISQLFTSVTFLGVLWRVLVGPIPYLGVALLVEILKVQISFNLALLNISHLLQFLMIYDINIIHQFKDKSIQATAVCVGCVACIPGLVDSAKVRLKLLAF